MKSGFATCALLAPALVALAVTPGASPEPRAGEPDESVVEIIRAERVEPDGRFSAFPRWTTPSRPRLALALSGGGARGFAHLGVLQAMAEDGIEIDAVAGTSIGALMGAFVCAGYAPDEIEDILRRHDWESIIAGLDVRHRVLSEAEDIRQSSALVKIRLRRGKLLEVGALVESRMLERDLYRYLLRAQLDSEGDFDRLRYPFRAVASDVLTGKAVVPSSGDLVALVRGSSAVPGVFRPVRFGEAVLVDGGFVENVPVDTARSFGADAVVAVDVTEGLKPTASLRGALESLSRSVSILMAAQGKDSLSRADLVLSPKVTDLARFDFVGNIDRLVRAGQEAYREQRDALWAMLESKASDPRRVSYGAIEVEGTRWITADQLAARMGGARGTVTRFRIGSELSRALNLGPFQSARAEIVHATDGDRLRFVFLENPPVREIVRLGDPVLWPNELGVTIPLDAPFSLKAARETAGKARQALIDEGHVLVKLDEGSFDPSTGTLTARISDVPIGRIRTEVEGEIRLERTQRFFEDLRGQRFTFDHLADRLDEMVARGAIFDWSLDPHRGNDGKVDLRVKVRGDDYYEALAGGAFRSSLGFSGYLRAAKANLTGRGDSVDLTVGGATEAVVVRAGYRTEYGIGFQNLGADVGAEHIDGKALVIDSAQKLRADLDEPYRADRGWLSLIHRLRWGAAAQAGLRHERYRLDATEVVPAAEIARTSAYLSLSLDRHDRLLFPTRGGAFRLWVEKSLWGDSFRKAEIRADKPFSFGRTDRHTMTGRFGLGLSQGAGRRPFWFDPGGYRDLYGFLPYGAAAPQYASAGATWRLRWFDVGAARLYLEAGVDAVRTALRGGDLRRGEGTLGYGVSVTAHTGLLGPIIVGAARNDQGATVIFLTAGLPFIGGR